MHAHTHKRGHNHINTTELSTMTTKTIECEFTHSKETKGAHQYKEDADDYKIGSLYLRKTALGGDVPQTIKAIVTYEA